jgi:3-phenylpropionate/trans-cinnamate dioxygenase ferredoxin reductase subunit
MTDSGCVVVGAGLTAANVVQTLREGGYGDPITLVGDETDRPYERPPLSKGYLQGGDERSSLYVHDDDWYAEHDIDARFGTTVVAVDRGARRVRFADGDQIGYERLVLATGASPRTLDIPGAGLEGVHTLRRIGDSDALRASLRPGARCVVVGAGWIGLEVAAAARGAGCEVTVLEYAAMPLARVLGDRMGGYFARLHLDHGVDLRAGVRVSGIHGSAGSVASVSTDDGDVSADVVVVGVGVAPNTGLARDAGLDVDNGILVDEQLRTSDPAVCAAGDVANAHNVKLGRRLRVEHWDNAIRQGRLAGATLLGRPDRYDWHPYFFTDQFDLGMEYVGYSAPDDEVVVRGSEEGGEFIAFWLRDEVLTAAMNVNIWDVSDDLRGLLGRSVQVDRLTDPDVALTDL